MTTQKPTNEDFLTAITESFKEFIRVGTSRSTAKLKHLHGTIAKDIASLLGSDYEIKAQGFGNDSEGKIKGRYTDKRVDIMISKNGNPMAGIAVKFVMQNYSQNSGNYFDNMLGETANIRCQNIPYFQIFIILDHLPYYNTNKVIEKWESFSEHNYAKYKTLSQDNTDNYLHTPNKTLIFIVHIPDCGDVKTKDEYREYYRNLTHYKATISDKKYEDFGPNVILNDYAKFISKVYYAIKAI